jgi:hypothetical protein
MKYWQCELKKGNVKVMSWLPQNIAQKGMYVKLLREDIWSNGWRIEEVYRGAALDQDEITERSQDYKHQRKASDV